MVRPMHLVVLGAALPELSLARTPPRDLGIPSPDGLTYHFGQPPKTLPIACPGKCLGREPAADNCANWIVRAYEMSPALSPKCPEGTRPLGSKKDFCTCMVPDITYTSIGSVAGPETCCTKPGKAR